MATADADTDADVYKGPDDVSPNLLYTKLNFQAAKCICLIFPLTW